MTDHLIDPERQAAADRRDLEEPRATSVAFDRATGMVVIALRGGSSFSFPARSFKWLAEASEDDLAVVEVVSGGAAIEWPRLDIQSAVPGLVLALAGSESWQRRMFAAEWASLAGSRTSDAKAEAARRNGAKGGRPRKSASRTIGSRTVRPAGTEP